MTDASEGPVRSINNDVATYVTFVNRSTRTVHLFWIDYSGKLVRYGKMPPQKGMRMNTYVTHPWIANDADTTYPLLLNGDRIFFPTAERNGEVFHSMRPDIVNIKIPVYPLVRRCLEVVYKTNQRELIREMNIPKELQYALMRMVPRTDYKDYKGFGTVWYHDCGELDQE